MGAIRNMTASGTDYAFYFTNSQSELYKFPNVTTPIYVAGGTITDLKFGLWDQASALVYGTGCAGSSGTTPSCVPSGLPTIGNSSFSLDVQDAPASAPGTLLLGTNRQVFGGQQLPFSLDAIGMMGCTLETDVLLTLGVTADAAGMASVGVPIPLFQWKGGRFTAQYFFLDAAANNLGVISSDAVEGIVR